MFACTCSEDVGGGVRGRLSFPLDRLRSPQSGSWLANAIRLGIAGGSATFCAAPSELVEQSRRSARSAIPRRYSLLSCL